MCTDFEQNNKTVFADQSYKSSMKKMQRSWKIFPGANT
jgi:hypothetical protein